MLWLFSIPLLCERVVKTMDRNEFDNLVEYIDAILLEHNHKREEIVCVLWGGEQGTIGTSSISLELKSFWRFAESYEWDNDVWASGPPHPLALLSGKGWWIEATEYDSRTSLAYFEEPKVKAAKLCIGENGELYDLEA